MSKATQVLIADDNRTVREALRLQLRLWGISSVIANDGEEAWRALQGPSAPRIAILDWSMPGADGLELCRRLRAREGDHYTYVILLTAHEGEEEIAAGFAAGADDYLFKGSPIHVLKTRLTVAARIGAVQEELLRARELLRAQARTDALTGLLNRRAGEEELERELRRAARGGNRFGIALLDVDRFKRVNDTIGHQAGDRVLKLVAEVMRTVGRAEDVLVRWGGEEFLMLFGDVDLAGATQAAERARVALMNSVLSLDDGELRVTASFGVAAVPEGGRPLRDLLAAADAALYRAKAGGRNSVVAEPSAGEPAALPRSRQSLAVVLREATPIAAVA